MAAVHRLRLAECRDLNQMLICQLMICVTEISMLTLIYENNMYTSGMYMPTIM